MQTTLKNRDAHSTNHRTNVTKVKYYTPNVLKDGRSNLFFLLMIKTIIFSLCTFLLTISLSSRVADKKSWLQAKAHACNNE